MTGRWWPRHVLVTVFIAACVGLGIWQLLRWQDRRAYAATLDARSHVGAVPIHELPQPVGGDRDPDAYRPVTVKGEFDTEHEVILRSHSRNGEAGNHVLTPLLMEDGFAILVDRGWVPLDDDSPPVEAATPRSTIVSLTGVLIPSELKQRFFGPSDPKTGTLKTFGRLDIARIGKQLPYDIVPLALLELTQDPPQVRLPLAAELPSPGQGPHLGYAIQWFLFAATALVVYRAFYSKERRRKDKRASKKRRRLLT